MSEVMFGFDFFFVVVAAETVGGIFKEINGGVD